MIGKIPKAGRGFKGVVSYLMHGARQPERQHAAQPGRQHDGERQTNARTPERANAKPNRVLWADTHNLLTRDPHKAVRIMRATANKSRRCKAPVYHFVISWTPEEAVSPEAMRAIVEDTCRDMGLADHQRIAIAHDDTRHKHVHVVVNRIHHETGTAWNRAQDWVRLEQSLARQAKARGLRYVPGRHNAPDDFRDKPKRTKDAELQRARRKGIKQPATQWNSQRLAAERARLARIFDTAQDWRGLHHELARIGLRLKGKGQGHVISDGNSEVKLSRISKTARIALLERRFQERYRNPQENPAPAPRPTIEQKPSPIAAKPRKPDAAPTHPQVKSPNTPPQTRLTVDPLPNTGNLIVSPVTQRISNAHPRKRNARTRKGPKL